MWLHTYQYGEGLGWEQLHHLGNHLQTLTQVSLPLSLLLLQPKRDRSVQKYNPATSLLKYRGTTLEKYCRGREKINTTKQTMCVYLSYVVIEGLVVQLFQLTLVQPELDAV